MSEPMFGHLKSSHEFFGLFHGIVVSAVVKSVKPEPAIYEQLRVQFALDFAESVFIDDLPRNVEGARALGLPAIHFESTAQVRRGARVHARASQSVVFEQLGRRSAWVAQ